MSDADWKAALPRPPEGYRLEAGLFTSYRPADASLLVEHILPSLLGLGREFTSDPEPRALYFGELAVTLEHLRGRLSVFSSSAAEDGGVLQGPAAGGPYPWLWRYIAPFTVGEVQHAKLWMFHWASDTERENGQPAEALELVISSMNLTGSAFRGQLQAGWRALLPLQRRSTAINRATWGPLQKFLEALGRSAGPGAAARTDVFTGLLGRCECPEGVQVVASIPGTLQAGSERRQWGSRALGAIAPAAQGPLHVHLCAPYVGSWTKATLAAWRDDVGVESENLGLSWIDTKHPWANSVEGLAEWRMPASALETLREAGVQLVRLGCRSDGPFSAFHELHSENDERWSHSKLYLLRRGRVKRLLVTSANWSPSAWGAGERRARNFELGVLLDAEWPLSDDELQFDDEHLPFCSALEQPLPGAHLSWAAASWDGSHLDLRCRTSIEDLVVLSVVDFGPTIPSLEVAMSRSEEGSQGRVPWTDHLSPPLTAKFTQGDEWLEVAVVDLRAREEFLLTPLPEMNAETSQSLRDALILEKYRGPMVEEGQVPGLGMGTEPEHQVPVGPSDYSVAAFIEARAWFLVVEAWLEQWERALTTGGHERHRVLDDGWRLHAIFTRRSEVKDPTVRLPAKLVAEELAWRLEEATSGG